MKTDRYTSGRPLLKKLGILNVYQLNLYQTLIFMFKLTTQNDTEIFQIFSISVINHLYPTRNSSNSFKILKTSLHKTDFSISCWGNCIWNNLLHKDVKTLTKLHFF